MSNGTTYDGELGLRCFCSDMNHSNMYAVGLALCTFANIASEEMSRDLANEIEKLLGSSNTYIRKKARTINVSMVVFHPDLVTGRSLCFKGYQESPGYCRSFCRQGQKPTHRSKSRSSPHRYYSRHGDVQHRRSALERIPKRASPISA